MRNLILLAACMLLALLVSSCGIGRLLPGDELNEAERLTVIERARQYLLHAENLKLSEEDRETIKSSIPKFHVEYTSRKAGIASIIWTINPSYSVRVTCSGKLLDPACPIQVRVSRFQM